MAAWRPGAEAVTLLMNAAIAAERSEHLGARPYERSATPERACILPEDGECGVDGDR